MVRTRLVDQARLRQAVCKAGRRSAVFWVLRHRLRRSPNRSYSLSAYPSTARVMLLSITVYRDGLERQH
jgi:hypothetical protein